jgi:hypothetical protein
MPDDLTLQCRLADVERERDALAQRSEELERQRDEKRAVITEVFVALLEAGPAIANLARSDLALAIAALLESRSAALARVHALEEGLAAVLDGIPGYRDDRGNAPGHGHRTPGVWDGSGPRCEWCATWARARALVGKREG